MTCVFQRSACSNFLMQAIFLALHKRTVHTLIAMAVPKEKQLSQRKNKSFDSPHVKLLHFQIASLGCWGVEERVAKNDICS